MQTSTINLNGSTVSFNARQQDLPRVFILHENSEWIEPLRYHLQRLEIPFEEWFLNEGYVDFRGAPPQGIFYNRMSASSHTRNHRFAPELTIQVLEWLAAHDRIVVNGPRALKLELSKFSQYLSLRQFGLNVPRSFAAVGESEIQQATRLLNQFPFILKPNRGGKGTGVQKFESLEELQNWLPENYRDFSLDGVAIVQSYIKPADKKIVRMEFVAGKFLYAVEVDASKGFELCPADVCQVEDAFCPVGSESSTDKFKIIEDYHNSDIAALESFMAANDIGIGAVEYVESQQGLRYYYDVNTNTNYNSVAEETSALGLKGMGEIAEWLGKELEQLQPVARLQRAI